MKRGNIYPKGSLILRVACGTASGVDAGYELNTGVGGNPIIQSETTGKYFSVSWLDLIEMAREAGIDEESR